MARRRLMGSTPRYKPPATAGGNIGPWNTPIPGGSSGLPTSTTPTPSTPGSAALPVDPTYDAEVGGLAKQKADRIARLTQGRTGALLDYGYNAQYDPAGNAVGLSFDPNNPNSRAAQLKRRYQEGKRGTTNSYAGRGMLWDGSQTEAQAGVDRGYTTADDQMTKALLRFLGNTQSGIADAGTSYELGMAQAGGGRVSRAASNANYTAAAEAQQTTNDRLARALENLGGQTGSSSTVAKTWRANDRKGRPGTFRKHQDGRTTFVPD